MDQYSGEMECVLLLPALCAADCLEQSVLMLSVLAAQILAAQSCPELVYAGTKPTSFQSLSGYWQAQVALATLLEVGSIEHEAGDGQRTPKDTREPSR